MSKKKIVLSIAGSDNTGGAGIQADIKTCVALGVYPATVITAVTAQNPGGVKDVEYVGDKMLEAQLRATLEYIRPDAVKIGLLPCSDAVSIIANALKSENLKNIVLDPVMSATAGGAFSIENDKSDCLLTSIREELLPLIDCLTPNEKELYRLAGIAFHDKCETECVEKLFDIYSVKSIVVTGGDKSGDYVEDRLYRPGMEVISYKSDKVESEHTHGTGCTFSSAVACNLALGHSLATSVEKAKQFTYQSIIRGKNYPVYPTYGPVHPI